MIRDRRGLLLAAAAGVGGIAAGVLVRGEPAGASTDNGTAVLLGEDNTGATARTGVFHTNGTINDFVATLGDPGNDAGVFGQDNSAAGGQGVLGASANGVGVRGESSLDPLGKGVLGTGEFGVAGTSGSPSAIGGSATEAGVWGDSESATGVLGTSDNGPGVTGKSPEGIGVEGTSGATWGVEGRSGAASTAGEGAPVGGVWGDSSTADGVVGTSDAAYGVVGVAQSASDDSILGVPSTAGVWGDSSNEIGVVGSSNNDYGVMGVSYDSSGVYGTSISGSGVYGEMVGGGVQGADGYGYGVFGTVSEGMAGVYGGCGNEAGTGVWGDAGTAASYGVRGTCGIYIPQSQPATPPAAVAGQDTTRDGAYGVLGYSEHGVAVVAENRDGNALKVEGIATFTRSGVAVAAGSPSAPLTKVKVTGVAGATLTSSSFVLATIQGLPPKGVLLEGVLVDPGTHTFTIYFSGSLRTTMRIGWMVLD